MRNVSIKPRHDRSLLLYQSLIEARVREPRERCSALPNLRGARGTYHSLRKNDDPTGTAAAQVLSKLRELCPGLGIRFVFSGAAGETHEPSGLN